MSRVLYYPYGETRWVTGTLTTDYGYTGQRHDSYTQLIEMGARWYDPKLACWASADTIIPNPNHPQNLNRYLYVLGNPLRHTDPSGHTPVDLCPYAGNSIPGCQNGPVYYQSNLVRFEGAWSLEQRDVVVRASEATASGLYTAVQADRRQAVYIAGIIGGDPSDDSSASHLWGFSQDELFQGVYGTPFANDPAGRARNTWMSTNILEWMTLAVSSTP